MSKFLDAVRNIRLGERATRIRIPGSLTTVSVDISSPASMRTATLYRVGVEVGAHLAIEDQANGQAYRNFAVKNLQEAIADEIYADVRAGLLSMLPDLLELKHADLKQWDAVRRLESKLNDILNGIRP